MESTVLVPQAIKLEGSGAIKQLPAEIKSLGINRLLVVTHKRLRNIGVVKRVTEVLDQADVHYVVYDAMQVKPTIENVNDGHDLFYGLCCDGLLSIGGCCQEHVAKAIKLVDTLGDKICGCEGACKSNLKNIPVIAVNTSACSGQPEVAIIKDDTGQLQQLMEKDNCQATIVVDDPELYLQSASLN